MPGALPVGGLGSGGLEADRRGQVDFAGWVAPRRSALLLPGAEPGRAAAVRLPGSSGHNASAQTYFDQLAYSHRKEWVRWVEEAKKAETRAARITKAVASQHGGIRTH